MLIPRAATRTAPRLDRGSPAQGQRRRCRSVEAALTLRSLAIALLVTGMVGTGCSAPIDSTPRPTLTTASPTADLEATVVARVAATLQTIPPRATAVPTPARDLAQSRSARALTVWGSPSDAYFSTTPEIARTLTPACTVAPFTDLQVLDRAFEVPERP